MIHGVKNVGKGRFIINDSIIIFDMEFKEKNVHYQINFDETKITEQEANELANEFLIETFENFKN